MKLALIAFSALAAVSARANVKPDFVTLDFRVEMDGKFVAGPRMIMRYGSHGLVAEQMAGDSSSYSVEVAPTKESDSAVALDVTVSQKSGGVAKTLFTSKVIAVNGAEAEVSRKQAGLPDLKLTVTPTF